MMHILGVGIATLDIVNQVPRYPSRDSEVRATAQWVRRGGNVTNSLVVLGSLGHRCSWAGTLADDAGGEYIRQALARHGVAVRWVVRHEASHTPTSYVTLAEEDGSRTIVHYRRLPEFTAADFSRIKLQGFQWVHFEGRNIPELALMLERLPEHLPRSLEVEKPREGIERLLPLAGVVMFSRVYAESRGFSDGAALLQAVRPHLAPGGRAFCAWGASGAWGMDERGGIYHSPAFPPPRVVDTLGAGDVFNAALIHGLGADLPLPQLLELACRKAGEKCAIHGLVAGCDGESG